MFNFKRIAAITAAFVMLFSFAACNKDGDEKETKAAETTEKVTYNETAPAEPLVTSMDGVMYPEYTYVADGENSGSYSETVANIDVVYQNYYGQDNFYVTITDLVIEDIDRLGSLDGYATVEVLGVGAPDKMRVGFRCYDENGEIVRNSFFTVWDTDKTLKAGDIVEDCRMDIPRETVKIEFFDYVGEQ